MIDQWVSRISKVPPVGDLSPGDIFFREHHRLVVKCVRSVPTQDDEHKTRIEYVGPNNSPHAVSSSSWYQYFMNGVYHSYQRVAEQGRVPRVSDIRTGDTFNCKGNLARIRSFTPYSEKSGRIAYTLEGYLGTYECPEYAWSDNFIKGNFSDYRKAPKPHEIPKHNEIGPGDCTIIVCKTEPSSIPWNEMRNTSHPEGIETPQISDSKIAQMQAVLDEAYALSKLAEKRKLADSTSWRPSTNGVGAMSCVMFKEFRKGIL